MTFHRIAIISAVAVAYYVVAWFGLYAFGAEMLLTSLILFGIPAYALARFSSAPTPVLISVLLLGGSLALLLESIAHTYGLWYTVGVDATRMFNLIPVEAIAATALQVLFLALVYEALFDDGIYTERSARVRLSAFVVLISTITLFVALEAYIDTRFMESPYQWLISLLLLACFLSLIAYRSLTIRFLDRLVLFTFVAAVPLCINLALAITNVHKVFANMNSYAYTYTLWGSALPLEELLLALTMPLLVATVYEIYLDDIA